jgi:hypothetical protein
MINDQAELVAAVDEVGILIQEISDYLNDHPEVAGAVRFPRGYIRTAARFRRGLTFIHNDTVLRNLSYAFMLHDVFRWILTRTDLSGTARDMVVKNTIVLIGSIVETLARAATAGIIGAKHNFKERTERMVGRGIITQPLKTELDWLWDTRSGIHIYLMQDSEYDRYRIADYERAKDAAGQLLVALRTYHDTPQP